MINKSECSIQLYNYMNKMGYPKEFSDLITQNLNTDYTAKRMIGYLKSSVKVSAEEVADEMLAILSDRNRFIEKKLNEESNSKWNMIMEEGFEK